MDNHPANKHRVYHRPVDEANAEGKLFELAKRLAAVRGELFDAQSKVYNLGEVVKGKDKTIKELREAYKCALDRIQTRICEVVQYRVALERANATIADLEEQLNEADENVSQLELEVHTLQRETGRHSLVRNG